MTREISDSDFVEVVLESTTPFLVDFWAPWCAPCTMIAATVEAIAQKYGERLEVGKINVDDNPKTAERYGIMGIPTLLFFVDGKVAEQFIGVMPRAEIERTIEVHL